MAHVLESQQWIPRTVDETFAFFSNPVNLGRITPPEVHFHVLTAQPIVMRAGTLLDYQLRVSVIPLRWRTRIEEWVPGEYFVDVQDRGPFRLWRHRHEFAPVTTGGTLMKDRLEYAVPFGPLGAVAHKLYVKRQVERIFAYRTEAIAKIFPKL